MRNFLKVGNVTVGHIQQVLWANPDLWNQHALRKTFPGSPNLDVDDIWLHFLPDEENVEDAQKTVWHAEAQVLNPVVMPLVLDLMRATNSYRLERLFITRLPPGGQILAHADVNGSYATLSDLRRYHVVLQGLPGSMFYCGEEEICMQTGDIWWFNAAVVHAVKNNSKADRVHLLVDTRVWV